MFFFCVLKLKIKKPNETRQAVWLDSLTHAREWLSGATLMRITAHVSTPNIHLFIATYSGCNASLPLTTSVLNSLFL